MFECRCRCHKLVIVGRYQLIAGRTKSCGCLHKEVSAALCYKHGLTKHPLYRIWLNMLDRCGNINHKFYKDYGGRGIKVCSKWQVGTSFKGLKNFIAWNDSLPKDKQRKEGLELDRINNNRNYNTKNCRWVTPTENNSNKRNTLIVLHNNSEFSLKGFWRKFRTNDVLYETAFDRYKRGWSAYLAVTTPINSKHRKNKHGREI